MANLFRCGGLPLQTGKYDDIVLVQSFGSSVSYAATKKGKYLIYVFSGTNGSVAASTSITTTGTIIDKKELRPHVHMEMRVHAISCEIGDTISASSTSNLHAGGAIVYCGSYKNVNLSANGGYKAGRYDASVSNTNYDTICCAIAGTAAGNAISGITAGTDSKVLVNSTYHKLGKCKKGGSMTCNSDINVDNWSYAFTFDAFLS